jgi:hypothetical protein
MFVVVSILLTAVVALAAALVLLSPGTVRPVFDEHGRPLPGSIAEKTHVTGAEWPCCRASASSLRPAASEPAEAR